MLRCLLRRVQTWPAGMHACAGRELIPWEAGKHPQHTLFSEWTFTKSRKGKKHVDSSTAFTPTNSQFDIYSV